MPAVLPTWPPSLPQQVQVGYTEILGVNVLRTATDAGPAKMRLRGRKPPSLKVSFVMTSSQVATLITFIENTIFGTYRFNFTHPRTQATVAVRIIPTQENEFFTLTNIAEGYYNVGMTLEVVL